MAGRAAYFRLYDHGRYMGEYRNSELMELLDIRHHQLIAYYSDTGREYKARYLIERIEGPCQTEGPVGGYQAEGPEAGTEEERPGAGVVMEVKSWQCLSIRLRSRF